MLSATRETQKCQQTWLEPGKRDDAIILINKKNQKKTKDFMDDYYYYYYYYYYYNNIADEILKHIMGLTEMCSSMYKCK